MKSSCITHSANSGLVIIREEYLSLVGHLGAAVLLGYFEYWHNIRLEAAKKAKEANKVAEKHGDEGVQDESLYQFHTNEEILTDTLGVIGRPALKQGIKILEQRGYISRHKNPNPRYAFDKTTFYLLHPDAVNADLSNSNNCQTDESENDATISTNCRTSEQELSEESTETVPAIPETTSETSSENLKDGEQVALDFQKLIFDFGIMLLLDAGDAEPRARSKIGKLRKDFGDANVLAALSVAEKERPSEPYSFLIATLKHRVGNAAPPKATGYQPPAGLSSHEEI